MKYLLAFLLFLQQVYPFTIRPAEPKDVDTLFELICELATFEGNPFPFVTKENLAWYGFGPSPRFQAELAETERGAVGYALYSYGFSANKGTPFLYIDDLYVKESERGQGIGKALLDRLAELALENGCCRMEWHAFDWNEKAIDFYQHLGGALRKDLLLIRMDLTQRANDMAFSSQ
ncbi:MAG: GNAT family N-acetyltransferase [Verrucomicrobia bacterium]|nr:GNAT family N-acetyltransferase [Verrucomicrobiota bacterium]